MPIMFNTLLEGAALNPSNVRLVRHHVTRQSCIRTPYRLWRETPSEFERYQSLQGREVFTIGNQLASFVRTPAGDTLFVGIYEVQGLGVAPTGSLDPATGADVSGIHQYAVTASTALEEYQGRLTIEWGLGALAWVQRASNQNKAIREIWLAFQEEPFPGFFLFRSRLSEIGGLPASWVERLRGAKGVYVLTSLRSGEHYIGSAAGKGGFHQRWLQHAAVGGDAVGLQAHGAMEYQVAILQVAAGFETDDDIVDLEHRWMDKLQTRGMGLNGQPRTDASQNPKPLE